MPSLWKRLTNVGEYRVGRLVDQRMLGGFGTNFAKSSNLNIICDIDKTYLETEFDSLIDMAKVAVQEAEDKITVLGATPFLMAMRWAGVGSIRKLPRPLHFVSSSPPQLRRVLERKLFMDGLDWDSDTFKNQAYNLRKGRVDQLRHHVAYKSAAILELLHHLPSDSELLFIGDNAESDTFIYIGIALLASGRLSPEGYLRYLEQANIEKSVLAELSLLAARLPKKLSIQGVLIRSLSGYPIVSAPPLTDGLIRFHSFLQASAWAISQNLLPWSHAEHLFREIHNRYALAFKEVFTGGFEHLPKLEPSSTDFKYYQALQKHFPEQGRVEQGRGEQGRDVKLAPWQSELGEAALLALAQTLYRKQNEARVLHKEK